MIFCKNFIAGKITLDNVEKDQSDLLNDFIDLKKRTNPRDRERKKVKKDTIEGIKAFYEG